MGKYIKPPKLSTLFSESGTGRKAGRIFSAGVSVDNWAYKAGRSDGRYHRHT
jgi:hypothetical protein